MQELSKQIKKNANNINILIYNSNLTSSSLPRKQKTYLSEFFFFFFNIHKYTKTSIIPETCNKNKRVIENVKKKKN